MTFVTPQDWLAIFLAAAGEPDIKEKLLNGYRVGGKTYKVHIDGFATPSTAAR